MNDAVIHRGPDDHGLFLDDCVGLGHRRLSIIDIEGGRQPIFNEDGTICVVFNGEIFNYVELRKKLQRLLKPEQAKMKKERNQKEEKQNQRKKQRSK